MAGKSRLFFCRSYPAFLPSWLWPTHCVDQANRATHRVHPSPCSCVACTNNRLIHPLLSCQHQMCSSNHPTWNVKQKSSTIEISTTSRCVILDRCALRFVQLLKFCGECHNTCIKRIDFTPGFVLNHIVVFGLSRNDQLILGIVLVETAARLKVIINAIHETIEFGIRTSFQHSGTNQVCGHFASRCCRLITFWSTF